MSKLAISFSGGETSAYMTWWILHNLRSYSQVVVIFANTGEENEETLQFVKDCDDHFGFGTVWVEAVVRHGERKGAGHKVVNYHTASRKGEPFEDMIRKYGIPNQGFKHCTRTLKLDPIYSYLDALGWKRKTYDIAIGIRADEIDRMSVNAAAQRIIYPLAMNYARATKPQINSWWQKQPFRLKLKGFQGNCKWCWKKSDRKLFTLARSTPEIFEFPSRMEQQYGLVGAEFTKHGGNLPKNYRRTFFRKNRTALEIVAAAQMAGPEFVPAEDDAIVLYDADLDTGGGCEESCEVFADEDAQP